MPITENSSAIYHLCGMKHWLKEMGRQYIEFLSDDDIKIKFVNLWDLSGHSERLNNVQEAYLPITSISWQIV